MDPGASHALRIRGIAAQLPASEQEQLYWVNVVDVPAREAKADDNVVQVAIRFRMKLLYRPQGLGTPLNPDGQVGMAAGVGGLALRNTGRHYFNLASMTLLSASGERSVDAFYLAPGEARTLALPEGFAGPLTEVRYEWVDDDGVLHAEQRLL
ncbi:molecular chaperone [Stenotrophomonas sp. 3diitr2024]|uniref:fimbrial biogenesis chaperone n=1 Tax=Stenotrophomonas sp. 3diitr2024 TaxID=3345115 RepID=UPI0035CAB067